MSHLNEALSAYLSGELQPSDRKAIEDHLKQCADCRRECETLRKLEQVLSEQRAIEVPPGFLNRVLRKAEEQPPAHRYRSRRAIAIFALAAAIVFIAILISFQQKEEPPSVVQQPPRIEQPQPQPPQSSEPAPQPVVEDAELIAHLDVLENMDVIENYENLKDLDTAILVGQNEE